MLLILLSRLLGFIRERAIADVFGLNAETDAFRLAFNIPDIMYFLLIAGGLNAAFIPVFTRYLAKGEEEEGWRVATTFFTVIVTALIAMVAVGLIFTPQLSPLVAYDYQGEQKALLVRLMRIMFPAVFFTALAGVGMGVHKSYKHFAPPMWGPIVYNVMIILATHLLGRRYGVVAMAYGTVAGAIGNLLIQIPFVLKKWRGKRFAFDLSHPGLKQTLRLMGPAVISLSIFQINFIVLSNLASGLSEGSPTALRIGQTIVQLPLGVFAMGVSMVILPALSGLIARNEMDAFTRTFSQGLRAVFFVTIPSAVGLYVLRIPVISLLFETGAFTASDTRTAAVALAALAVGLWAQAGSQVLIQVFYSLQETKTLVRVSLIAILLNTSLSLLLLRITPWEHGALALAYSLTAIANLGNYLYSLRRKIGRIDGARIVATLALSAGASLVMGGVVHWLHLVSAPWFDTLTLLGRVAHLALSIGGGVLVYGGLALLFRMEEVGFVAAAVKGNRRASRPESQQPHPQ